MSRAYDVVLLGASGFTGALTAEYLAKNAPDGHRWAVAGRNKSKLERFGKDIVYADVTKPESLRELAESSKVVATTVGPYIQYGEPLVAACAEAGTGYLDLTGEPEFLDRMYVRYHERATQTGRKLHLLLAPNPSHLELVNPVMQGIVPRPARARSSPVKTASTPGAPAASPTSSARMRACACGERSTWPNVMRGSTMSST